jgi:GLPGLI family protein
MKKINLLLLYILVLQNLNAQNNNRNYLYSLQTNGIESFYSLEINNEFSFWKEIEKMKINDDSFDYSISFVQDENYTFKNVYININDSIILSNQKIIGKNFYIIEDINGLDWELTDLSEDILGYKCQAATTNYKGRKYTAYFTTDITTNFGPWKFHGLPGMILKVISTSNNEVYKMECLEIKKSNLDNPKEIYDKYYESNQFISWDEFLIDVNNLIENHIRSIKSRETSSNDGGGYSFIKLRNYLEVFNEKIQMEGVIID